MRTRLGATLAALALAAPAVGQPSCITAEQAGTLVQFALPPMIEAVARRCTPVLPRDAYLARSGAALAARFRAAGSDVAALRPLLNAIGGDRIPPGLSDATVSSVASDLISSRIVGRLPLDQCRYADATLELLDPLPPRSVSRLTVLLLRFGVKLGGLPADKTRICPESRP